MNALSKGFEKSKDYIAEYRTDISILLPKRRKGGGQLQNFPYYANTEDELHKQIDLMVKTYFSEYRVNSSVATVRGLKAFLEREDGECFSLISTAFKGESFYGCIIKITNEGGSKELYITPEKIHEQLSQYRYVLYAAPDYMVDGVPRYILVVFFGEGKDFESYLEIRGAVIKLIDPTNGLNLDNSPVHNKCVWPLPLYFAFAQSFPKIVDNPGIFMKLPPIGTAGPPLTTLSTRPIEDNNLKENKVKKILTEEALSNVSLRLTAQEMYSRFVLSNRIIRILSDCNMSSNSMAEEERVLVGRYLKGMGVFMDIYYSWLLEGDQATDMEKIARLWKGFKVLPGNKIEKNQFFLFAKSRGVENYLGEDKKEESVVFNENLCDNAPKPVSILIKYILSRAMYPDKTLALAGAISCLGYFYHRRIAGPKESRPNVYVAILARSGFGKGVVTSSIDALCYKYHLDQPLKRLSASAGGLVTYLDSGKHHALFSFNEFGEQFLYKLSHKNTPVYLEELLGEFKNVYSASNQFYKWPYLTQDVRKNKFIPFVEPHVSVIGASVPEVFLKAFSTKLGYDGALSRFMVFMPKPKKEMYEVEFNSKDQEELHALLSGIVKLPMSTTDEKVYHAVGPKLFEVSFTKEAESYYKKRSGEIVEIEGYYAEEGRKVDAALYARVPEQALKLALISQEDGYITLPTITWAFDVVECYILNIINNLNGDNLQQTEFEKRVQHLYMVLRRLKERYGPKISMTLLAKNYRTCHRNERNRYLDNLKERGLISITQTSKSGSRHFTEMIEIF